MKTKTSKILLTVCVFLASAVVVSIIYLWLFKDNSKEDSMKNISYVEGAFTINYNDLREVVGSADYVFVGHVISKGKTENDEVLPLPVTEYSIRVEENIKGQLITDEDITIFKDGGISDISGNLVLFEGDYMPETGHRYVFYAYAQPDGTLLLSGPISNVSLESSKAKAGNVNVDYSKNKEYLKTLDAYENEIMDDNERLTCKYDINAKK